MDLSAVFGLPPEEAIRFFESKGYRITWDWYEAYRQAHDRAFTVAKLLRADILQDIRAAVGAALAEGKTERWFIQHLAPILKDKGWWGRKIVVSEDGQAEVVQEGSPRRLKTIFRTNMQTAYAAGRWKAFQDNAADRPYLQYVAVMDGRTRKAHAALHGRVFPIDSVVWRLIAPPNGFGCRCAVRALSEANIRQRGLRVERDIRVIGRETPAKDLANKRTGEIARENTILRGVSISDPANPGKRMAFYPDQGWDYNPGARWGKPFAPPPLDDLPRSFPTGIPLPEMLPPMPVPASRLLPEGLAEPEYARAFLAEFGADIGAPAVFRDVAQGALTIDEALFQRGDGGWKADKRGRGRSVLLLADTIKRPDEIWLRWEEMRNAPGLWVLRRRYIKAFTVVDNDGKTTFGVGSFEFGEDGWKGATVFPTDAATEEARRAYIERQRDGFLLYRRRG